MRDESKATVEYLSRLGRRFSWGSTNMDEHQAGLRKLAVNDPVESSFGGTKHQIQYFARIGLTNAGGVDQVKRNGELSHGFKNERNKRVPDTVVFK